jgi:hypothetical protein
VGPALGRGVVLQNEPKQATDPAAGEVQVMLNIPLLDALADDVKDAREELAILQRTNVSLPGSVSKMELLQAEEKINAAVEALVREEGGVERLNQLDSPQPKGVSE